MLGYRANKRRLVWGIVVAFLLVTLLSACGQATPPAPPKPAAAGTAPAPTASRVILKLAHESSADSGIQKSSLFFVENVKKRTGGQVEVQVFPAGQLGTEREIAEGVKAGTIDMGLGGGGAEAIDPRLGVLNLPFLFKDFAESYKVLDGPGGQKLLAMGQDKGFKILAILDSGSRQFVNSSRPILKPEDLKGMRLRTPQMGVIVESIKALGALPVAVPLGEAYTAMKQKTVDGAEPEISDFIDQKWYEVTKYMSRVNYIFAHNFFYINLKKFSSLTPEQQKAIQEAAVETNAVHRKWIADYYVSAFDLVKQKGIQISDVDVAPFRAAARSVYTALEPSMTKEIIEAVTPK